MKTTTITKLIRLSGLVGFLASSPSSAQKLADQRVVQMPAFCQSVTQIMMNYGTQQGLDPKASTRLAGKATDAIINQLKTGKMSPFMDAETMEISVSTLAESHRKWLSLPEVLVSAMGAMPRNVIFIDQVNELRFLSQTAPRSQILLLADSQGEVDANRARLVAQTARALGLQMHVIWAGKSKDPSAVKAAQGFAMMSAMTGGSFLDMTSGQGCAGI